MSFTGLFLSADPDELMRRVTERQGDVSDADAQVVRRQLAQDWGQNHWIALDTSAPDGFSYSEQEVVDAAVQKTGLMDNLNQG